jgi:hypothetical protein
MQHLLQQFPLDQLRAGDGRPCEQISVLHQIRQKDLDDTHRQPCVGGDLRDREITAGAQFHHPELLRIENPRPGRVFGYGDQGDHRERVVARKVTAVGDHIRPHQLRGF